MTSICMDMTLQEVLEIFIPFAYFSGQKKQRVNALPLSKIRNLSKEILLERRVRKILPVGFAV